MMGDYDGQMIFGDLGVLKLPDICLTGEGKSIKNLTQETCPDRGSNPGPLNDRHACYHLAHSGGPLEYQLGGKRSRGRLRYRWGRMLRKEELNG